MQPRMLVTGGTYLITRTTSDRRYLLQPSAVVREVFLYCLFRAANRSEILVHGAWVESTHVHMLVTDTSGDLSKFMAWVDRHVAECLLAHYRRRYPRRTLQKLWSPDSFNATLLVTREAVIEAFLYGATNFVKDGLVPDYRMWSGVASTPRDWLCGPRRVRRPKLYFKSRDDEFAHVQYRFTVPTQLANLSSAQLVRDMERLLEEEQRAIRARRGNAPFLGMKAVLAADPFDSPEEPRKRGERVPTVKAGSGQTSAYQLALAAVRGFREAYRAARRLFCAGQPALFPAGTLLMRTMFGVPCAPADFGSWCCLGVATSDPVGQTALPP